MRPDLLSPVIIKELQSLQDAVAPFDSNTAIEIIKNEMKVNDLSDVFVDTSVFSAVLTHLLTHSLTHSYLLTYLLTYSLTHSLTHLLSNSRNLWLAHPWVRCTEPSSRKATSR